MISAIIPLMPVKSYPDLVFECVESLKNQSVEVEIILVVQPVQKYINKNALLNFGFEKATGDWIFHCDVDFTFDDENLLEKMSCCGAEAVYPFFFSEALKRLKVADGAAFVSRETLEKHGPLDESGLGISLVTFPLMEWCLENAKVCISTNHVIQVKQRYASAKRIHYKTRSDNKECYYKVNEMLDMWKN